MTDGNFAQNDYFMSMKRRWTNEQKVSQDGQFKDISLILPGNFIKQKPLFSEECYGLLLSILGVEMCIYDLRGKKMVYEK